MKTLGFFFVGEKVRSPSRVTQDLAKLEAEHKEAGVFYQVRMTDAGEVIVTFAFSQGR